MTTANPTLLQTKTIQYLLLFLCSTILQNHKELIIIERHLVSINQHKKVIHRITSTLANIGQ